MITVSNAGPLIHLCWIGQLDLLRELYGEVIIPQAVYEEVVVQGKGQPGAEEVEQAIQEGWIIMGRAQDSLALQTLQLTLHPGEAETLVLAKERGASIALLDDDLARRTAMGLGLKITGTVGVLLLAESHDMIRDLKTALDELRAKGFWLSDRIYHQVLHEVDRVEGSEG
jgi:predicted nucleic acid-binding protein